MTTAADILSKATLMPVASIDVAEDALPMARALAAGGLKAIEITLRTPAALDAIEAVAKEMPDFCVGVGTVTSPDDLARSVDAGAKFAISPGQTPVLLEAGQHLPVPFIPAVATASDILACLTAGYTCVKFFPAEASGGIASLKSFAAPFPQMRFCPTGGINAATAPDYLALPSVVCVGGSWMLPAQALRDKDWAAVEAAARAAVEAVKRR